MARRCSSKKLITMLTWKNKRLILRSLWNSFGWRCIALLLLTLLSSQLVLFWMLRPSQHAMWGNLLGFDILNAHFLLYAHFLLICFLCTFLRQLLQLMGRVNFFDLQDARRISHWGEKMKQRRRSIFHLCWLGKVSLNKNVNGKYRRNLDDHWSFLLLAHTMFLILGMSFTQRICGSFSRWKTRKMSCVYQSKYMTTNYRFPAIEKGRERQRLKKIMKTRWNERKKL